MSATEMKICSKCGDTKSTSEFGKHARESDGLQPWCKLCARLSAAEYRAANPEKVKQCKAEYRAANPDKVRENNANRYASNPALFRVYSNNRRARKHENGGKLSPGLAAKLFKLQRGKCACCHVSIADGYHMDHVIALALEGQNEDWNMQLLCGPCNTSKGAKHPVEFMQSRGFLL